MGIATLHPYYVIKLAAFKMQFREKLTPMSGSLYDERFYKLVNWPRRMRPHPV